ITRDGLVVAGSESGLVDLNPADVVESGRLGPGELLVVDTRRKAILRNGEAKREVRSEEHTSELQSPCNLVCRLLLEKKKKLKKRIRWYKSLLAGLTGLHGCSALGLRAWDFFRFVVG